MRLWTKGKTILSGTMRSMTMKSLLGALTQTWAPIYLSPVTRSHNWTWQRKTDMARTQASFKSFKKASTPKTTKTYLPKKDTRRFSSHRNQGTNQSRPKCRPSFPGMAHPSKIQSMRMIWTCHQTESIWKKSLRILNSKDKLWALLRRKSSFLRTLTIKSNKLRQRIRKTRNTWGGWQDKSSETRRKPQIRSLMKIERNKKPICWKTKSVGSAWVKKIPR